MTAFVRVFLYQEYPIWSPDFAYHSTTHDEIHHEELVTSSEIM